VNWVRDPPVGDLVVEHDGIAARVRAVVDREALPERPGVDGPEEPAALLRVHGERQVVIAT
jgi:hypothetical protein